MLVVVPDDLVVLLVTELADGDGEGDGEGEGDGAGVRVGDGDGVGCLAGLFLIGSTAFLEAVCCRRRCSRSRCMASLCCKFRCSFVIAMTVNSRLE